MHQYRKQILRILHLKSFLPQYMAQQFFFHIYKERKCSYCIIEAQHELPQAAICGFAEVPGEKMLFILASSDKHLHFYYVHRNQRCAQGFVM